MRILRKLFTNLISFVEKITIIQCIRRGLVMTIPAIIIGSMALAFRSLPIPFYQSFIHSFINGAIVNILSFVYDATFGILSIYLTFNIALSYAQKHSDKIKYIYGAPIVSIGAFIILIGITANNATNIGYLDVTGMFTAIFSSIVASYLYTALAGKSIKIFNVYAEGMDSLFNNSTSVIVPAALTLFIIAIFNYLIHIIFNVGCFQELFVMLTNNLFIGMGRTLLSELLFVIISSLLWFFGIHGSNVLESVSRNIFVQGLEINMANVANGLPAIEIVSKTFFDIFVVMGGCGTTLCLLIAILIFSKRKSSRSLAKISFFPMIFNINEPMIFGLPVIFNPILFIPFITTPVVCTIISYFALASGIVPLCTSPVEWTTPVFLSGYIATGSIRGGLLQLMNLIIGVIIYKPFIKLFDDEKIISMKQNVSLLKDIMIKCESNNEEFMLASRNDNIGDTAKMLVEELKYAISHDELNVYYQPQYDNNRNCIGAEALLRWNHLICGMIYPPLIIKLADESDLLLELENKIFDMVSYDIKNTFSKIDKYFKICINVSASTLQNESFEYLLKEMTEKQKINPKNICIEVTEQMTLNFDKKLEEKIDRIKKLGFSLAIDDFSMGHTSIKYLKSSIFNMVKLDGSLVQGMNDNPRCENIIESITNLGQSLDFDVLAEFVETQEQCNRLQSIGCFKYQGYLFSPAVPKEEFIKHILS